MCNREAPSVEEAAQRWAGKVTFVGVAWSGDEASFQGFIDEHGLTFAQISDPGGDVFARFEVPGQPALVVVSTDGDIQQVLGAVDEAMLDQMLGAVAA